MRGRTGCVCRPGRQADGQAPVRGPNAANSLAEGRLVAVTGELPHGGVVRPRDGNEWNASAENLILTKAGRVRRSRYGGLAALGCCLT